MYSVIWGDSIGDGIRGGSLSYRVGAEYPVDLYDLGIFVNEAAKPSRSRRRTRTFWLIVGGSSRGQEGPVARAEPRPGLTQLPLQDRDLVAQRQDLHVLVPVAHRK